LRLSATPDEATRPARPRLAEFRIRCGRPGDDELVFGEWSGDVWDNWRERIFQPTAVAAGLPEDTIPRDLRGSFASLLIYEGLNVLEVAPQLGHKPSTCLDIYGRLFEEFDPARRRAAIDVIRDAPERPFATERCPLGYPAEPRASDRIGVLPRKAANSSLFGEALCRTRTGDPFLTMEVLYQLS
jgi:hypothetical protein